MEEEYISGPSDSQPRSPIDTLTELPRYPLSSTPKPFRNRMTRSQSVCITEEPSSISTRLLEERIFDLEEQLKEMKSSNSRLSSDNAGREEALRHYEDQITSLEKVDREHRQLLLTHSRLRDDHGDLADKVAQLESAMTSLKQENDQLHRALEMERKTCASLASESDAKDQLIRESEMKTQELEMSFSTQLEHARAQLQAADISVTEVMSEEKQKTENRISHIQSKAQEEIQHMRRQHQHELQRLEEQHASTVSTLKMHIADLSMASKRTDPVVVEGIGLVHAAPQRSSILSEIMEALPGRDELSQKVEAIESENRSLKGYIDTLLCRIIEKYPQILEK